MTDKTKIVICDAPRAPESGIFIGGERSKLCFAGSRCTRKMLQLGQWHWGHSWFLCTCWCLRVDSLPPASASEVTSLPG